MAESGLPTYNLEYQGYFQRSPQAKPAYDAADIARAREGLRKAGHPDAATLTDDQVVAEYVKVADQNDPFTQKLKATQSGTGALGGYQEPTAAQAAKDIWSWAEDFKRQNGRAPSPTDFESAWGPGGRQAAMFYISTGGQATQQELEQATTTIFTNTPPTGSMGSGYSPEPSLDYRRYEREGQQQQWQNDYQQKQFEAKQAYDAAQLALQQGNQALAQQQFALAQKAQSDANAIQQAGITGTYNGQQTMAGQQQQFNQQFQSKQFEADQAEREARLALARGDQDLANRKFEEAKAARAQADQFTQAGITGTYGGQQTLAAELGRGNLQVQQGQLTLQQQLAQVQAAKAGNPLAYLYLSRGQQPSGGTGAPGGTQISGASPVQNYAGMPTLYNTQGAQGAQGAGGPEMPPALKAVLEGRALTPQGMGTGAPGGTAQLRAAGAQAQANEDPVERAARREAVAMAGKPEEVQDWEEQRIRRNLGGGLRSATYRATGAPGGR